MNKLAWFPLVSMIMIGTAAAQQTAPDASMNPGTQMKMMIPNSSDSASTRGYKAAMMRMMESMPATYTDEADMDFMMQMRAHHFGAIDMAKVALAYGKDPEVKALAQEIVAAQEKEIAVIDNWIKAKGK